MKVALISCSKLKNEGIMAACDLYSKSQLFNKMILYTKNNYDIVYILSAKYGLLKPYDIIESYDITLNTFNISQLKSWSNDVNNKIQNEIIFGSNIDMYCGIKYRKYLIPLLTNNYIVNVPFIGLGIGQQLKKLNELNKRRYLNENVFF